MDRSFVEENARERKRLRSLVGCLTDEELDLPLGNGWTVAVAFAHLAFWDQRSLTLMRKWKESGVALSPIDIDIINDSLLSLWQAIPPRAAANLAVSSAEAIDRELEEASSDLIAEIEGLGEKFRLYRSIHRKLHLDHIEELLNKKGST
ncbi:MAG: DinB family protein [Pseudomonadota bacterium]